MGKCTMTLEPHGFRVHKAAGRGAHSRSDSDDVHHLTQINRPTDALSDSNHDQGGTPGGGTPNPYLVVLCQGVEWCKIKNEVAVSGSSLNTPGFLP